jgi:hypothetical protein
MLHPPDAAPDIEGIPLHSDPPPSWLQQQTGCEEKVRGSSRKTQGHQGTLKTSLRRLTAHNSGMQPHWRTSAGVLSPPLKKQLREQSKTLEDQEKTRSQDPNQQKLGIGRRVGGARTHPVSHTCPTRPHIAPQVNETYDVSVSMVQVPSCREINVM